MTTYACNCIDSSIFGHLSLPIKRIVHKYLHSKVKETFYKAKYKIINLDVCLNKEYNEVIELNTKQLADNTQIDLHNFPFQLYVVKIKDIEANANLWLFVDFIANNTSHLFRSCLTANIVYGADSSIPVARSRYQIFHQKLVKYFDVGNKNTLLSEILEQCGDAPNQEDYDKIWCFLHIKVANFICNIDFWTEIHR